MTQCLDKKSLISTEQNLAFGVESTLLIRIFITGRDAMAVDLGPGYEMRFPPSVHRTR